MLISELPIDLLKALSLFFFNFHFSLIMLSRNKQQNQITVIESSFTIQQNVSSVRKA
jgi:hypothetical protein